MLKQSSHNISVGFTRPHRGILSLLLFAFIGFSGKAQYAPAAGMAGSTAIPADSAILIGWATGCTIQRGYRDIAVPDSGYASVGDQDAAIGKATENGVVSLGDAGEATLTFASPIVNGAGFDFAVFENGFWAGGSGLAFLEYAFVEVSSDGIHFVRFPSVSNNQDTQQMAMIDSDCALVDGLAGKYTYGFGTPFDLDLLKDSTGIDVNNITHVRVIDVIGSINPAYASRDSRGHMINDPYPTNFASSGFDLDAVGVIHQRGAASVQSIEDFNISFFPNPVSDRLSVITDSPDDFMMSISDANGSIIWQGQFAHQKTMDLSAYGAGLYHLSLISEKTSISKTILKL
jgi:hypothetical protein